MKSRRRVNSVVMLLSHKMLMRPFRRLTLIFLLMLFLSNLASAKPWRGIVPLQSSRADVLRILGNLLAPTTSMIFMRVLSESCNVSDAIVLRLC